MKKRTLLYFVSIFLLISATGCKEKSVKKPVEKEIVNTGKLVASDYKTWTYFSFKTGKRVEDVNETNFKERLDWDIAFHLYNVRLNGGASGKGKAGFVKLNTEDLASVKTAPESGYIKDVPDLKVMVGLNPNKGPVYEMQPYNKDFDWLVFKVITPPNYSYTMNKNIYVVTTADGKYAKIQFLNYLGDKGEKMNISFNYVYQPDGTRQF